MAAEVGYASCAYRAPCDTCLICPQGSSSHCPALDKPGSLRSPPFLLVRKLLTNPSDFPEDENGVQGKVCLRTKRVKMNRKWHMPPLTLVSISQMLALSSGSPQLCQSVSPHYAALGISKDTEKPWLSENFLTPSVQMLACSDFYWG